MQQNAAAQSNLARAETPRSALSARASLQLGSEREPRPMRMTPAPSGSNMSSLPFTNPHTAIATMRGLAFEIQRSYGNQAVQRLAARLRTTEQNWPSRRAVPIQGAFFERYQENKADLKEVSDLATVERAIRESQGGEDFKKLLGPYEGLPWFDTECRNAIKSLAVDSEQTFFTENPASLRRAMVQIRRKLAEFQQSSGLTQFEMQTFKDLPEEVKQHILMFVGGQSRSNDPPSLTRASANDPKSLVNLMRSSRALNDLVKRNAFLLGLGQVKAAAVHAGSPHHGSKSFEDMYPQGTYPQRFYVVPDSINIFKQHKAKNAFSGVANVVSGEIVLYPLAPPDPAVNVEGYQTTAWSGDATYRGEGVVPIVHRGDPRAAKHADPEAVSHEVLARYINVPEGTKKDRQRAEDESVGFTLNTNGPRGQPVFVWSSRSLNKSKFRPGRSRGAPEGAEGAGHTTQEMAQAIVMACAEDLSMRWDVMGDIA